ELRRDLDGRRERHAALTALLDVVLGLVQVVRDEHELARSVEVPDRENALEHPLQADVRALSRRDLRLQKLGVTALLNVDQVGNVDYGLDSTQVGSMPEVRLNL